METLKKNNVALGDKLLDVCNPDNVPVRIQAIVEHVGRVPEVGLSNDEIDQMVRRIFRACRGENGRPRPVDETGQIVVEVTEILASHIKAASHRFPDISRMPGRGSFA